MAFILILDLDNVGVDIFIISLSFITSEILKKVYFSLMAVANLQPCVKQRLLDKSQQDRHTIMYDSNKCLNYRIFKDTATFENYLNDLPFKLCNAYVRFRCCNNKLPIEVGSHYNIPINERVCTLRNRTDLGDEFHFVLVCPHFSIQRRKLKKKKFYCNPSTIKLMQLFQSKGEELLNLCKFVSVILEYFD